MRSLDELITEICTLAGHINAANHRFLTLIAEFDRRKGWSDSATQSCAHWLNWKCGIAIGAAREKVRVARALGNLPKISAAMASGKVSYSKAREITRVGDAGNEDYLLAIAEHGTAAHVEKLVRAYRRCQEAEELSRDQLQQQRRRVSCRYDDDGSLILTCHLPAEAGALVLKALDIAVEGLPIYEDVPAGTSKQVVPFGVRRAAAPAADRTRQGMSFSRMLQLALHRHAPHQALGERWRDQARESYLSVPISSPRGSRRWVRRRRARRRRGPLHASRWRLR
jgi:hypothetical protein